MDTIIEKTVIVNGKKESKFFYYINDTLTGEKLKRLLKGCSTRKEAEELYNSYIDNKDQEYLIKNIAKKLYTEEHLNRLAQYGKKLDIKTIEDKKHYVKLIVEKFGNYNLKNITAKEIELFLLNDKRHSNSWKCAYIYVVNDFYEETKWSCSEEVPKPAFHSFVRNSKTPNIFTTQELQRLFHESTWDNPKYFLFFYSIATLGLRISEAQALRPCQFHFDENYVEINGFIKKDGSRTTYNKKGNSRKTKFRIAPLSNELKSYIQEYLSKNNFKDDELIFNRIKQDGSNVPENQNHLRKVLKREIKKANISLVGKKLTPHSLRFTYVTRMRRFAGGEDVQKIVGHSSIEMTEYYTKAGISELLTVLEPTLYAVNKIFE